MFSLVASAVLLTGLLTPVVQVPADVTDKRMEIVERQQVRAQAMEEKREEFMARVQEIQNAQKQWVLTNLVTRFTNVNEKWTSHWTRVLTRFSEILAKMEVRLLHIASETGKDVSLAQAAISEAEEAILAAQEAVNAQAEKVYIADIDDEDTIGGNVRALVQEFRADLREVLEEVKAARMAMTDALSSMKTLAEADGTSEEDGGSQDSEEESEDENENEEE